MKERDVVLQGEEDGQPTIDYPVTRLELVEGAEGVLSRVGRLEVSVRGAETAEGKGPPTSSTPGKKGEYYLDTDTGEEWKCVAADESGTSWERAADPPAALSVEDKGKAGGVASLDSDGKVPESQLPSMVPFSAGTAAPADKTKLWIDTTANTGGLKYWNGSAWVYVPVAYA